MGVMGWVVCPLDFLVSPWPFENGALSKIDDVLAEDGGLLHVLPLTVHLKFCIDTGDDGLGTNNAAISPSWLLSVFSYKCDNSSCLRA